MPDSLLTIIAGRDPPVAGWLTTPGWAGLVRELHLGPAGPGRRDADAPLAGARRASGGAGQRASPAATRSPWSSPRRPCGTIPELRHRDRAAAGVIGQLLDALVADLPERTIETLEAASTARRVTEPILRALLARADVRDEFDALRRLPFVERTRRGAGDPRRGARGDRRATSRDRDPEAHARYRRRAWSLLRGRARARPPAERPLGGHRRPHLPHPEPRPADRLLPGRGRASTRSSRPSRPTARRSRRSWAPTSAPARRRSWGAGGRARPRASPSPGGRTATVARLPAARRDLGRRSPGLIDERPGRPRVGATTWRATPAAGGRPRAGHAPLARARQRRDAVAGGRRLLARREARVHGAAPAPVAPLLGDGRPDALAPIFVPLGFAPVGDPVDVGGVRAAARLARLRRRQRRRVAAPPGRRRDRAPRRRSWRRARRRRRPDGSRPASGEVLALIAEGLSNRGHRRRLVISEKTAGRHVSNLFCQARRAQPGPGDAHRRVRVAASARRWGVRPMARVAARS